MGNVKHAQHLAKSQILNHPKFIPFTRRTLFGESRMSLMFTEFTYFQGDVPETHTEF